MGSRFYQWYNWYTNIVQVSTNGTICNTNGTNGNVTGTIGSPNGTIDKPMVALVLLINYQWYRWENPNGANVKQCRHRPITEDQYYTRVIK